MLNPEYCLLTPAFAQTPALTTVRDTVYKSDGTPASGMVVITWQGFVSADSRPVFGGNKTIPLAGGALAVALVPNAGGTPSGTSYRVRYYQSGGVYFEETWVVPSSLPLANPAIPVSVTQNGTPGSTTYHYWCSATNASGETLLSPARITTTSNATLSGTNYNVITCATVSGATGYKVYRTTTSTAPTGTGAYLVGSTAGTVINDQSNTLNSATIPTVNHTDPKTLSAVRVTAAPSPSVQLAAAQVTGTAIVANPSSTQTITAPSSSGIPLQITGRSNNSSNVFEIYDNQPSPQLQSYFNPAGALVSAKPPTFSSMTSGSLLFAGTGGLLSQDNANFFWDNTAKAFRVGPRTGFSSYTQNYVNLFRNTITLLNPGTTTAVLGGVSQSNASAVSQYGLYGYVESAHSSGNRSFAIGTEGDAYHSGSGTLSALVGVNAYVETQSPSGGNVLRAEAVGADAYQTGASTTTDLIGFHAYSNGKTAGAVTNNYGLKVDDQNIAGATNWAIKTGLGKVEFGDTVTARVLNAVRLADQFPGADAGAKIAAAIADLPSTGGTVDARGLEGAQTLSSDILTGVTKPLLLLLGAATYTV
ncbi:MAG: hypothetical protein HY316_02270 [Acidobacteria bacterium]|nr:hypothetical protein [Acidobacteriota bacterium]